MKICLIAVLTTVLFGCSSFDSSVPAAPKQGGYFYLDPSWLNDNQKNITDRLVATIKASHPITARWFPRVSIVEVEVESKLLKNQSRQDLQGALGGIFDATVDALYDGPTAVQSIDLTLKISAASKKMNSALYALMVPYGAACWSTLMLVCPVTEKSIVVVEGSFNDSDGNTVTLRGAGAARLVALSPYAGDSSQWNDEAETKALVAAVARLADAFVKYSEQGYQKQG